MSAQWADWRSVNTVEFHEGDGRIQVHLRAEQFGDGLTVTIYNQNPHIGAVAIGDYDFSHQRASVSILTRLGHKDDALAQTAAHDICKATKKPVCVIAGVHLDDISPEEIRFVKENAGRLVDRFISHSLKN